MAALAGAVGDPLRAAVAASVLYKEAAARAGKAARGPGSFAVAFLDELWRIGAEG
jgi:hydroxyethylthiazole kinase